MHFMLCSSKVSVSLWVNWFKDVLKYLYIMSMLCHSFKEKLFTRDVRLPMFCNIIDKNTAFILLVFIVMIPCTDTKLLDFYFWNGALYIIDQCETVKVYCTTQWQYCHLCTVDMVAWSLTKILQQKLNYQADNWTVSSFGNTCTVCGQ